MPPYPFGKGAIASSFEAYVHTKSGALDMLRAAWDEPLGRNVRFRQMLAPDDIRHLDEVLYPTPDTTEAQNRREVVRNGIRRALEIALAVPSGQKPTEQNTRAQPWPVELFWGCGASVDQCWVSSRPQPSPSKGGQVTIILQLAIGAMPAPRMTGGRMVKASAHGGRGERALYVYRGNSRGGTWVEPARNVGYVQRPKPK